MYLVKQKLPSNVKSVGKQETENQFVLTVQQ